MAMEQESRAIPWGTLQELLLVCAVHRHGANGWDSIAVELRNRSSSLAILTGQDCERKFNDLKRRFRSLKDGESVSIVSMVDELRRIRVEELRREVKRRDVSIVLLELKVKKLEEDRRKARLKEASDLEKRGVEQRKPSPDKIGGKSVSDDISDDRSFNESNSPSRKGGNRANGVVSMEFLKRETGEKGENDPGRVRTISTPGREWSSNGKLDDDDENNLNKINFEINNTKKMGKSAGEPTREGKSSKQSSDVQNSASLSERNRRVRSGGATMGVNSSGGEEPEFDEVSPATTTTTTIKRISAIKTEPFAKFFSTLRSHRLGSMFERRLQSQSEMADYRNMIRQHMDLQIVKTRLSKGMYSDVQEFYRDILLLFNNVILFFPMNTREHAVALQLRDLVLKELSEKSHSVGKPDSLSRCKGYSGRPFLNRTKERSVVGQRNSRTSNKIDEIKHECGGNELSSHDALEVKIDTNENNVRKRRPKRIKRDDYVVSESDTDEEESRRSGRKRNGRRVIATRSSSRRGVGRPPKRTPVTRGRGEKRDSDDEEVEVGGGRRPRKHSRR